MSHESVPNRDKEYQERIVELFRAVFGNAVEVEVTDKSELTSEQSVEQKVTTV